MATVIHLRFQFEGSGDKKISISFPYANAAGDPALVKALSQVIVANGDVFAESPLAPIGAEFVIRSTIAVPID